MSRPGAAAQLVDRHPTVSPERLIAQLVPPPTFAGVSFESFHPDPAEPSQAAALRSTRDFAALAVQRRAGRKRMLGRPVVLPGAGLYLDGGFGVGKTHLLASLYFALATDERLREEPLATDERSREEPLATDERLREEQRGDAAHPSAFATFGELTQLAGVFGYVECIDMLADYTAVCIDEFELDDPGNTVLVSRLLSELVARGVSIAATSNTLPEQLGEGRFAAEDFLREINTLARIFTTVRIDGPDYRHRDLPPAPEPLTDDEVRARAAGIDGATVDDFDALCAHLATMHPSRYLSLIEGVRAVFLTGVHRVEDQNVALRLVALTDRLYDAGIPVVASGDKLDTIFSEEMLAGGFRKKYLRATSRLLALTGTAGVS